MEQNKQPLWKKHGEEHWTNMSGESLLFVDTQREMKSDTTRDWSEWEIFKRRNKMIENTDHNAAATKWYKGLNNKRL